MSSAFAMKSLGIASRNAVWLWIGLCLGSGWVWGGEVEYSRDVRPILSRHCFKCHGPDEGARKAGLRLDVREGAVGRGSEEGVVIPGDPEDSELIYRVFTEESMDLMPPPSADAALSQEQKRVLRLWVQEGAEYEPHWAFVGPERPEPPEVRREEWVRNPIDRFVLAELEERGWEPSGMAERAALARRLHLDLVGFPPTAGQLEEYLNDVSSDAYERMVDRLLASPHYGERWARLWMDLARYADTNGYEKDRPRSIWAWRDWVVDALNGTCRLTGLPLSRLRGTCYPRRRRRSGLRQDFIAIR